MNSASAVAWRTQPPDKACPSCESDWIGTPSRFGISWKPMLSPFGPVAKRTIIRMQMFGWSMLQVNEDRE
jgi:hypothetical protein